MCISSLQGARITRTVGIGLDTIISQNHRRKLSGRVFILNSGVLPVQTTIVLPICYEPYTLPRYPRPIARMSSPNRSQRPPSPVKTNTLRLHYPQNNQGISAICPNPTSFTNFPPRHEAPVLPPNSPAGIPPLIKTAPDPRKRLQPSHTAEPPAKKHSRWLPEEDTLLIRLRGNGLSWEELSKELPGRSAISCRLHYQNYLERRVVWTEDENNKLARLYTQYVIDRPYFRPPSLSACPTYH